MGNSAEELESPSALWPNRPRLQGRSEAAPRQKVDPAEAPENKTLSTVCQQPRSASFFASRASQCEVIAAKHSVSMPL